MDKATKEATKRFPKNKGGLINHYVINDDEVRSLYAQGYRRAEKETIERACDMLMNYVFEEVTPEMRDHFRKRLEEE